jgi:serine/threonine protein phosphatase 1
MQKHYVIGDVHGEYEMLLALVNKLPSNARLIFVGDLISRGKRGKDVMEFVRNSAYGVVKGNHEDYMLFQGKQFFSLLNKNNLYNLFKYVGGSPILQPYKVLKRVDNRPYTFIVDEGKLEDLKRDLEWVKSLPIYLKLDLNQNSKPIVITHASIGDYWHLLDANPTDFRFYSLNNRFLPQKESPIFNIFGHLAVDEILKGRDFVCVDTGCGKRYRAKLSAYCIETKEIIDVSRSEAVAELESA